MCIVVITTGSNCSAYIRRCRFQEGPERIWTIGMSYCLTADYMYPHCMSFQVGECVILDEKIDCFKDVLLTTAFTLPDLCDACCFLFRRIYHGHNWYLSAWGRHRWLCHLEVLGPTCQKVELHTKYSRQWSTRVCIRDLWTWSSVTVCSSCQPSLQWSHSSGLLQDTLCLNS